MQKALSMARGRGESFLALLEAAGPATRRLLYEGGPRPSIPLVFLGNSGRGVGPCPLFITPGKVQDGPASSFEFLNKFGPLRHRPWWFQFRPFDEPPEESIVLDPFAHPTSPPFIKMGKRLDITPPFTPTPSSPCSLHKSVTASRSLLPSTPDLCKHPHSLCPSPLFRPPESAPPPSPPRYTPLRALIP